MPGSKPMNPPNRQKSRGDEGNGIPSYGGTATVDHRSPILRSSEQSDRLRGVIPTENDWLSPLSRSTTAAYDVLDRHRLDVKPIEHAPFDRAQPCSHLLALGKRNRHTVSVGLVVRWMEVKQRVWPVVSIDARSLVEALDKRMHQPQVCR